MCATVLYCNYIPQPIFQVWRIQGADWRWWRSPRRRRRADEPGRQGGYGGPRRSRWLKQPRRRRGSGRPRWSWSDSTEMEPTRRRSLKEPEGWGAARGVVSRSDGWSTTEKGWARGMWNPGGASGLMGHGREEGARSHGGADGSKSRGGIRNSEAGGGDKGFSSHDADEDWQTHGDPTAQMVGWGWGEGDLWDSRLSGLVCAAHTHQIATPSTGSTSDRGTTGLVDSSGQTSNSEEGGRRNRHVRIYICLSVWLVPRVQGTLTLSGGVVGGAFLQALVLPCRKFSIHIS